MNPLTVHYTKTRVFRTAPLTQYDYGQRLTFDEQFDLPEAFEVHFSNDPTGQAVTMIGTGGVVAIPDEFLTSGEDIHAWLYLHATEAEGNTVFRIQIPVQPRAEPTAREPTPVEQDAVTQAIAALNSGVDRAEEAATTAEDAAARAEEAAKAAEDAGDASRVAEDLREHIEDMTVHLEEDEKEYLDNPPQFSGIGNKRLKEILGW